VTRAFRLEAGDGGNGGNECGGNEPGVPSHAVEEFKSRADPLSPAVSGFLAGERLNVTPVRPMGSRHERPLHPPFAPMRANRVVSEGA
jgi:hypothetical protein